MLATSMLARMKLVLVQSLGVRRIVISVKPLPPRLNTVRMRRMLTLTIAGFTGDAYPVILAVIVSAVVVLMLLLTLTSDDSDVISSAIIPFLFDRLQQHVV